MYFANSLLHHLDGLTCELLFLCVIFPNPMKKWEPWCIIFHFQRILFLPSNWLRCTPYGFLLFLKPLLTLNVYLHLKLSSFQNLTYLLQFPFFWLVENFTYYSIRVVVKSLVKMFKGGASKSGSLCLTRYPTLMNPINPSKINYMILPTNTNISSSYLVSSTSLLLVLS